VLSPTNVDACGMYPDARSLSRVLRLSRVTSKLYSLLELKHLPAHSRGGLVLFCLDTKKGQKKSRQKKASPRRPDSLARFSVVPLPAFVFGSIRGWFFDWGPFANVGNLKRKIIKPCHAEFISAPHRTDLRYDII
jgi:hypothetical protein